MPPLPSPCLMALTDRTRLSPNWTLAQAIAPAVTGGANFVLFREHDLPPTPRSSVFRFVKDGVGGRVPLVVVGSAEWARDVGADGVHLEGGANSAAEAREIFGPDHYVGVTVATLDEARAVGSESDYALIYVDWAEPDLARRTIERFASILSVPLIVGPNVPLERTAECINAGSAGIAITDGAMSAYDRTGAVRKYADLLGLRRG